MNTAIERLPEDFREASFWKKLGRHALKAGKAVVCKALTLYYCMRDGETPAWAKELQRLVLDLDHVLHHEGLDRHEEISPSSPLI